jgi:hypothetical protein
MKNSASNCIHRKHYGKYQTRAFRAAFIRTQRRGMKRADKIIGLILKLNNLKRGISSLAIAQNVRAIPQN